MIVRERRLGVLPTIVPLPVVEIHEPQALGLEPERLNALRPVVHDRLQFGGELHTLRIVICQIVDRIGEGLDLARRLGCHLPDRQQELARFCKGKYHHAIIVWTHIMVTACRAGARLAKAGALLVVFLCAAKVANAQDLPSRPLSLAVGRIALGTDLTVGTTPHDDTEGAWFNYTDYEHNALRMLRLGVTAEVRITDRLSVLTDVGSENGDAVRAYALYVRVRPWRDRPLDIQAGRIPPTFGAFSRRDYGAGNPLIGYPLAYQYLTAVRPDELPSTAGDVIRMRARGWRPSYPIGSHESAPGLPLITAFRWDTGAQVRVGSDALNLSAALTNGTVSDPHLRDNNSGKQLAAQFKRATESDIAFAVDGQIRASTLPAGDRPRLATLLDNERVQTVSLADGEYVALTRPLLPAAPTVVATEGGDRAPNGCDSSTPSTPAWPSSPWWPCSPRRFSATPWRVQSPDRSRRLRMRCGRWPPRAI